MLWRAERKKKWKEMDAAEQVEELGGLKTSALMGGRRGRYLLFFLLLFLFFLGGHGGEEGVEEDSNHNVDEHQPDDQNVGDQKQHRLPPKASSIPLIVKTAGVLPPRPCALPSSSLPFPAPTPSSCWLLLRNAPLGSPRDRARRRRVAASDRCSRPSCPRC